MRITFLTPHINISGGVKIILRYASRLAKRGHKVTVICPQPTFVKRRIKGLPIIYPQMAVMNLLKYKPDWIEVAADIKYVPSYEEKYIPDGDIIVATAWQTAPYVKNYSPKKGKKFNSDSELIVNPVDLDVFYPTRTTYDKSKIKRICMLHHIYVWKGVQDGIKAFEIVKEDHPEIQLVTFGAYKKTVDINCEYHYRPIDNKLRKIYNSCDIFLCPSWSEGFGLPSAEAMACKCALVTTDNGGCRDYAIHGVTALVSPPRNPEALAENLKRLLDDENFLRRIAENGYQYIKQFTWDKAVDKMEKLFSEELKG